MQRPFYWMIMKTLVKKAGKNHWRSLQCSDRYWKRTINLLEDKEVAGSNPYQWKFPCPSLDKNKEISFVSSNKKTSRNNSEEDESKEDDQNFLSDEDNGQEVTGYFTEEERFKIIGDTNLSKKSDVKKGLKVRWIHVEISLVTKTMVNKVTGYFTEEGRKKIQNHWRSLQCSDRCWKKAKFDQDWTISFFKCKLCFATFNKFGELTKHIQQIHPTSFNCKYCYGCFANLDERPNLTKSWTISFSSANCVFATI